MATRAIGRWNEPSLDFSIIEKLWEPGATKRQSTLFQDSSICLQNRTVRLNLTTSTWPYFVKTPRRYLVIFSKAGHAKIYLVPPPSSLLPVPSPLGSIVRSKTRETFLDHNIAYHGITISIGMYVIFAARISRVNRKFLIKNGKSLPSYVHYVMVANITYLLWYLGMHKICMLKEAIGRKIVFDTFFVRRIWKIDIVKKARILWIT